MSLDWEGSCLDCRPLTGKVAVITGTSGQLGPIWVETVKELGGKVWGMDLPDVDVSNMRQVMASADECLEVHGAPSVLILNAAIDNPPGSDASFHGNVDRIVEVNLIGATNTVDAFLYEMIKNGGGVIIPIVSIMGRIGADWRNYADGWEKPVGYNLSKAALEQYVRSLTTQYGRYDIRACGIGFGPYDGGKLDPVFLEKFLRNVPLGRPVSERSAKATMTFALTCPEFAGQTVMIDGGYTAW